jgi:uncharacterized protein (DUF362 family)
VTLQSHRVAVERGPAHYPARPPFDPDTRYPEFEARVRVGEEPNPAYSLVRDALASLGFDAERFDTPEWNPLRGFVRPGETVLIKPNLIRPSHLHRDEEWEQIVTHGAVIRPLVDYILLATGGEARIVIADGPQTDSDFDRICERNGLFALVEHYRAAGQMVELLDLRRDRWYEREGVLYRRETLPGDPAGYTTVDLAEKSEFIDYDLNGRFYGADYDMEETRRFHSGGRHAYVLCRTVLDADVIINVPKLKTHKKTGVTLALKNMVGVNGYRNCLPHHTLGTPEQGGDEFPAHALSRSIESTAIVAFKRLLVKFGGVGGSWARAVKRLGGRVFGSTDAVVRSGNWHGNDTLWRTVLDLNKVMLHYDGAGNRLSEPRRYLAIVDGIVAGEGDGPVVCDARAAGVIVAGANPVAVDTVCATLMGFDYERLKVLDRGWVARGLPLVEGGVDELRCTSRTVPELAHGGLLADLPDLAFRAHFGWRGQIERQRQTV